MSLNPEFKDEHQQKKSLPIQRVLKKLTDKVTRLPLGQPAFSDKRYIPRDFSAKFFNSIPQTNCESKIGFIDGGNASVFDAPNVAIHLSRIYFSIFQNGKRVNPRFLPQRIEFYTICYTTLDKERVFYEADFVPILQDWTKFLPDISKMKFDSFDPSLMSGRFRAPINRVAETARRFAEWKIAGLVCEYELDENDLVVRDGTLQTSVTNESIYSNEAMKRAIKNNVIFCGLAKTSGLFTSTGFPLFAAIAELAENSIHANDAWFYNPIVDINHPDHRAEMYAVKLHPNSEYVFRLELLKDQFKMMDQKEQEKCICSLAECSKDASFPGYPYGLIDADRFARVSANEAYNHNLQLLSFADRASTMDRLKRFLKTSDAHELLNKI